MVLGQEPLGQELPDIDFTFESKGVRVGFKGSNEGWMTIMQTSAIPGLHPGAMPQGNQQQMVPQQQRMMAAAPSQPRHPVEVATIDVPPWVTPAPVPQRPQPPQQPPLPVEAELEKPPVRSTPAAVPVGESRQTAVIDERPTPTQQVAQCQRPPSIWLRLVTSPLFVMLIIVAIAFGTVMAVRKMPQRATVATPSPSPTTKPTVSPTPSPTVKAPTPPSARQIAPMPRSTPPGLTSL